MKELTTVGSNALILETPEDEVLDREASLIERRAEGVPVTNDVEFDSAGGLLKEIKQMQKKVKEYWEPLRAKAKAAYDDVLSRKKEMLDPLEAAEKTLKTKMGAYSDEKNRKARMQEEAMRLLARQEMERKLEEAAAAEAEGDAVGAEFALAEAEVMEGVASSSVIRAKPPKADGVSRSRTWEIVEVDSSMVPVNFGGEEIRPVDLKAVMRIIKASKGTVQIPGIKYEEKTTISVRG